MSEQDTQPALEAETGATALSDALNRDNEGGAAPQAQPEPSPQAASTPEPQPQAAQPDPAEKPEKEQPFWYRKEIEKERKARQALERQIEQMQSRPAPQAQPQPGPQGPSLPNPAEDPVGFANALFAQQQQQLVAYQMQTKLDNSSRFARVKFGDDAFQEAYDWLETQPPETHQFFMQQPDPWAAAVAHYQREKMAAEIGDDPRAWQEAQREKIRQEIIAEMNGGGQTAMTGAPQTRAAPPAPASAARSAGPARAANGQFTPTSLADALRR